MSANKPSAGKQAPISELRKRVSAEIQDNFDEDIELELEDSELAELLSESEHLQLQDSLPRRLYFKKLKLVVIFEGRDSAGKGGAIKRVTQRLNPRVCRAVALPAPTERERSQWYFQRYIQHLPAGGEIVLFDRSWYNRAGVERVMGFCTDEEYEDFFRSVPDFERLLVRSGIVLVKYWFSITDDEQHLRFLMRINDPLKQWKLSPMDLESRSRWEAYTKAKEIMLERTHIPEAPWWVVEAVDKKRARLNCIAHLLTRAPYQEVPHQKPALPARVHNPDYHRHPVPHELYVPDHYANLAAEHAEHMEAQGGETKASART
jgi:polyphosphate kinase